MATSFAFLCSFAAIYFGYDFVQLKSVSLLLVFDNITVTQTDLLSDERPKLIVISNQVFVQF